MMSAEFVLALLVMMLAGDIPNLDDEMRGWSLYNSHRCVWSSKTLKAISIDRQ